MREVFLFLFFFAAILFHGYALEERYPDLVPVPYEEDEFPSSVMKLRRAAVIFTGSYPLSLFFTKFGMEMCEYAYHGFDSGYAPSLMGGAYNRSEYSEKRIRKVMVNALIVSGCVTAVDFMIHEIKERKKNGASGEEKWKR